ncbi:MAG: DUF1318 domain-containing protein [Candidatus Omnitrophota bacterium]
MKDYFVTLAAVVFVIGCARLSVQGAKEPIKVDISMRLDVYQHVEKDIDAIEGIVSGEKNKNKGKPDGKQSLLGIFMNNAYAQEGLSPEVEQAALRRKDRIDALYALEKSGAAGENKLGMVEIRDSSGVSDSVNQLINSENSDRLVIYKSVADKNNTSLEDVQKLYAKRLRNDAPAGTPIEVLNQSSGSYEWKVK